MTIRCSQCEEDCVLGPLTRKTANYFADQDPFLEGFDAGFDGSIPESPNGCYLEGFCDGVLESEAED